MKQACSAKLVEEDKTKTSNEIIRLYQYSRKYKRHSRSQTNAYTFSVNKIAFIFHQFPLSTIINLNEKIRKWEDGTCVLESFSLKDVDYRVIVIG